MQIANSIIAQLTALFPGPSMYGFSGISSALAGKSGCKCAIVTLAPLPSMSYSYTPVEFHQAMEALGRGQAEKLSALKAFLDGIGIKYASPPTSPGGGLLAEFSCKWAAAHAGLGFIGKNDVFTHFAYAQRVRISCLLVDYPLPVFAGRPKSLCGDCRLCVDACPHGLITGASWHPDIRRDELVDYRKCALNSKWGQPGPSYSCAYCALACKYSDAAHLPGFRG